MHYIYLSLAILSEVIATSALKASDEFTNVLPSVIVLSGYVISFYFLSLVLKTIPVGIAYAIWSGVGVALITLIGAIYFKQKIDLPAVIGITLIVAGVVVLNIFSKTTVH